MYMNGSESSTPGYEGVNLMICPYNNAHVLRPERFAGHLMKCKKNYPNAGLRVCNFNNSHHIERSKFEEHHRTCPDRLDLERVNVELAEPSAGTINLEKQDLKASRVEVEENWDNLRCHTYRPEENVENRKIIRRCVGYTPAQRKEFYESERLRLQKFEK